MIGCEWVWLSAGAAILSGGCFVRPRAAADDAQNCQVCDCIAEAPSAWDRMTEGRTCFLSRQYLRLLEQHGPAGLQHRYVVVYREGRPAAAMAMQLFDVEDELLAVRDRTAYDARRRLLGGKLDRAATWLRNTGLGLAGRRVLVCGNLFSCGLDGVAWSDEVNEAERWPLVLNALTKLCRDELHVDYVVVKDLAAAGLHHRAALRAAGFSHLRVEPSMDLRTDSSWRTREDYLGALNTKYRKAAVRLDESIARYGATVEPLHNLAAEEQQLHDLYLQVERRARMRFGAVQPGYFSALAQAAGPDKHRCTVIRKDGKLLGFSLVIKDGTTALAHIVGFDYAANEESPIYHRLLHSVIDDGLALGCTTLHYGRTALEPKARLGATATDTEIWIKHTRPLVNPLIGPLLSLARQDTAPPRSPFRHAGVNGSTGITPPPASAATA